MYKNKNKELGAVAHPKTETQNNDETYNQKKGKRATKERARHPTPVTFRIKRTNVTATAKGKKNN